MYYYYFRVTHQKLLMVPLCSPNSTKCYTNTEDTRGYSVTRHPAGAHFPLQNQFFSSLEGTKPCISFTKRTLWLHRPPWGVENHWVSFLFSHMDGPRPCISMENAHCLHMAPHGVQIRWKTNTLLAEGSPMVSKIDSDVPDLTSYASEPSSAASEPTYGAPKHRSYTSELNSDA